MSNNIPIDDIRRSFPSLREDKQVYLDNAGGSQILGTAINVIKEYFSTSNVQLGATYAVGKVSTEKYNKAFEAGAGYINANVEEIVYGASTTQLFRNLSWTLNFKPGDEIVVSYIDHEANIAPWLDLAERQKLTLKWWKPKSSQNPELLPEDLETLLSPRTRLVTCTHASNVLGTITDIKSIVRLAHRHGALVCVDGVAYAPHRTIDVKELDVDFYCFSWYKLYGPHVGMLYASWAAQTQMKSLGHFFNPHVTLADKIGLSGGSYELCQAVPSVVEYLRHYARFFVEQELLLQEKLLDYLKSNSRISIYGSPSHDHKLRLPTISFTVSGMDSTTVVEAVERQSKFAFRWGAFYSNRLVRDTLGLRRDGAIRVSMVHYNTVEEVDGLIQVLRQAIPEETSSHDDECS